MERLTSEPDPVAIAPRPSRRQRSVFLLIVLAPAALLAIVLLAATVRLIQLGATDARRVVAARTSALLEPREPPVAASSENGIPGFYREGRWVRIDRQGATTLVHVLGASSVVLPSESEAFPGQLQARLDASSTRIANLGQQGMTTDALAVRGGSAIGLARPDLILFYEGHNDTTLVYGTTLQAALGFFRGSPLLMTLAAPFVITGLTARWRNVSFARAMWSRVVELELDPDVMAALGRFGLPPANPAAVQEASQLARTRFMGSLSRLLAQARAAGTPVVVVTPISNLELPPRGLGPEALEAFEAGMRATDRSQRLSLLKQARDLDVFNGMMRAKRPLLDAIRGMDDGGTVHVLDLERELERDPDFGFGHAEFFDAVHLRPAAHARIARVVHEFLLARKLLPH
jgi:hypothetical protein